jgi:hypothetical protein
LLVRLCFMEYSINALVDWLPCEKKLLFGLCPSMHTYENIAVAMCDVFRQDAILTGFEDWGVLNKAASVSIERCMRVCRCVCVCVCLFSAVLACMLQLTDICGAQPFCCRFKVLKLADLKFKSVRMSPSSFSGGLLDLPSIPLLYKGERASHPDWKLIFDEIEIELTRKLLERESKTGSQVGTGPMSTLSAVEACSLLQESMCVHALPECVVIAQVKALNRMHGACTSRLRAAHTVSFCILCAVNGKGFQCKLRMCCISGKLSCVSCPEGDFLHPSKGFC